ncbi:hypothetical protein CAEBREN_24883 [Caenorhabditis brenneri]|uniref:G-protein coupled receptors family 1 profile domain-containing protein n=1 Tax=Caenorhabditis brenneri TaxID=135651 RepID=G0P0G0_CAEBE|nr:hypothetical protein CAEBREN_24883 [Caenorhabditis brenneri]
MAAVAMMDVVMLTYAVVRAFATFFQILYLCYSKETDYAVMTVLMVTEYARNFARRCSTWFSLSISIVRTLVIRYPMSTRMENLSRPKAAFVIIGGIMAVIIPVNILDVFRLSVNVAHEPYICSEYGMGNQFRAYDVTRSQYFKTHYELVQTTYKIIDGITSKMIPFILFPIATVFLILEIRKSNILRKKMTSQPTSNNSSNTSYLVLVQTLAFFIAELPLGTIFLLQSLFDDTAYYGVYKLLISFEIFFTTFVPAITSSHMVICMFMSSQYRMNALMVIRCGYPLKEKKEEKNLVATRMA